jgi:hypothetical protein
LCNKRWRWCNHHDRLRRVETLYENSKLPTQS